MTVRVVTDSSACLPQALASEYDITVVDFHAVGEGDDETTAGLGALELTACYARLLERSGDEGVVALHVSKELSGTWSSATQAADVLDGLVEVIDTRSAGMVLGQAAIAAARCADEGGSLDECRGAAQHVIDTGQLWLFVNRLDTIARGGRLTAGQRLLSTALAIKPIMHLAGGRLELAAKTRTRAKAMERMVTLAANGYREVAEKLVPRDDGDDGPGAGAGDSADSGADSGTTAGDSPLEQAEHGETVVASESGDSTVLTGDGAGSGDGTDSAPTTDSDGPAESADDTGAVDGAEVESSDEDENGDRPRIFNFGGRDRSDKSDKSDKSEKPNKQEKSEKHDGDRPRLRRRSEDQIPLADLPRVPMHLAVHHREAEEVAEELRMNLRETLPECVVISVVDISHSMAVHTGPGALAVSLVED